VLLVGQAPGDKEPKLGRPFAWTAVQARRFSSGSRKRRVGRRNEARDRIHFAAGLPLFPRQASRRRRFGCRHPPNGSDAPAWLEREFVLLRPRLALPVGKLAISQFLGERPLAETIGQVFTGRPIAVTPSIASLRRTPRERRRGIGWSRVTTLAPSPSPIGDAPGGYRALKNFRVNGPNRATSFHMLRSPFSFTDLPPDLLALAAPQLQAQREKFPPEILEYVEKTWPEAKKTNTGLRYIIVQAGSAHGPRPGKCLGALHRPAASGRDLRPGDRQG